MDSSEDVRLSPERYRAAAAFLIKAPFYFVSFGVLLFAFGFWKAALLAVLFALAGGRRLISSIAERVVRNLPSPTTTAEEVGVRSAPRRPQSRPSPGVIDLDPSEFSRS